MPIYLKYDDKNMKKSAERKGGASTKQLQALRPRLKKAYEYLEGLRKSKEQGFFDLPYDKKSISEVLKLATETKKRFKTMVVVGIGGSDLGGRMLYRALKGKGMELKFISNPDPDEVADLLKTVRWKETALNVISKSGGTLETASLFMTLQQSLIRSVGKGPHAKHIMAITDPVKGTLRSIVTREGYKSLPHPENVGGRFAVLSNVGLFPAACAGIDVSGILRGAKWTESGHRKQKYRHAAAQFAAHHFLGYMNGRKIHVLMPYSNRLYNFGQWYRQIWAESLGKINGSENVGPTPVAALGTVDQHSQIQLYNEGPDDKIVTFIEVEKFDSQTAVPRIWKNLEGIAYIGGHSFEKIMHAERYGTAAALTKNGRQNATLFIPSISPESIGALVQFFELATAYMGHLLRINTFNQPGVEEGKILAKKLLT